MQMNFYICPVCGYDKLTFQPSDHEICPCCGTEFEYDDCVLTHADLRQRWLAAGAQWFSKYTAPPPNWNWFNQLLEAGLIGGVLVMGTESGIDPDCIPGPAVYPVSFERHYELRF